MSVSFVEVTHSIRGRKVLSPPLQSQRKVLALDLGLRLSFRERKKSEIQKRSQLTPGKLHHPIPQMLSLS